MVKRLSTLFVGPTETVPHPCPARLDHAWRKSTEVLMLWRSLDREALWELTWILQGLQYFKYVFAMQV